MGEYNAENSVPEFYHLWFADGTDWDNVQTNLFGPAPGFLVGGANEHYTSPGPDLIVPPENQPAQKSYISWNSSGEHAWEITENQITYQASYIRLLSKFASSYNPVSYDRKITHTIDIPTTNYPNPYNESTTILFKIEKRSNVLLSFYSTDGKLLIKMPLGEKERGIHQVVLDQENSPEGVFYCQIQSAYATETIKMHCMK